MKFLHTLVKQKIAHAMKISEPVLYDDVCQSNPNKDNIFGGVDQVKGTMNDETVLSLENLVHIKPTPASQAEHKLAKTSILQAMEHLGVLQEKRMMDLFKINHKLMPFLCYDNVDIQLKIHNSCVDKTTRLFHGTWGFFNVFQSELLAECSTEELGLPSFVEAMAAADKKPVNLAMFCPKAPDMEHWKLVIKGQLAKALKEYVDHIPGLPAKTQLPSLRTTPPPIDPISMHKPNIHFLRMMEVPDSSAEGVSRVLDKVLAQIGLDSGTYAKHLLVAGGDVGLNQLVESLRIKHFPPIDLVKGYEWVLSIFGGAHTSWNFTKSLWNHHWGDPANRLDSGVWQTMFALGLEYKKPATMQDFNIIMQSCQMVHKANLIFVISEVLRFGSIRVRHT
ncbi:uncharacterized protein MELLADRAFT_65820 [Melampsora larici-populina 98AG31]|uniref:DUF6589 domain-containing protein n=1 Tax=Melampsora larici-populina (strain 98AG31 / pathotype 3-4-7) TaxID=747676 RepID=F4RWU0_MELLP|nr:uncharacterized protein MELLADRAFT_65820 [Melampsora larici-populina 98AG31]EGG03084.1 hypothetical protein MELLADRAFT_65820 [Melampsora larici-populina 98AG31]